MLSPARCAAPTVEEPHTAPRVVDQSCCHLSRAQVADATTLKAARSLLASLVQPARAVSRWQSAGKLVTSAVAVAAPAQEAKQLKPKAEALQAAAAAASTAKPAEADADDAEELQAAVQFWEDWEASKGKPDSKSWTDQQVKLWCVRDWQLSCQRRALPASLCWRDASVALPAAPCFAAACELAFLVTARSSHGTNTCSANAPTSLTCLS
jgi:hypothetical protein